MRPWALLFWTLAILLIAGGQGLHAWQEMGQGPHADVCNAGDGHDDAEVPEVPCTPHDCCAGHSPITFGANSADRVGASNWICSRPAIADAACPEGPVGEIDYPPQLG